VLGRSPPFHHPAQVIPHPLSRDAPSPRGQLLATLGHGLALDEVCARNPSPPPYFWFQQSSLNTSRRTRALAITSDQKLNLHLAESRMRSTKGQGHDPKPLVKEQDVMMALEVLGMTSSLSDTLLSATQRNSLQVIRDSHDKGNSRSQVLTYDKVEREILKRKKSKRGRRSASTTSRSSGTSASVEDVVSRRTEPPMIRHLEMHHHH
jgi:hypothetical protein